jgi:hypothetical protein
MNVSRIFWALWQSIHLLSPIPSTDAGVVQDNDWDYTACHGEVRVRVVEFANRRIYAMIELLLEDLKESTRSQIEEGEEALGETNLNDTV